MYQQAKKEMAQKEQDIQEMMTLADEAFQQKNGSTERLWAAKIQKQQEDFKERDAARLSELAARDETIARLRMELAQAQVANRRLSSHFSFPPSEPEDDFGVDNSALITSIGTFYHSSTFLANYFCRYPRTNSSTNANPSSI
jgi:hypothetical protein